MSPDVIEFRVKNGVLEYRTIDVSVDQASDNAGYSITVLTFNRDRPYTNWMPVPTVE